MMTKPMHSLLKRQFRLHLCGHSPLGPECQAFIDAVNEAYYEFDSDRAMLERSLELSSQELLEANSHMQAVFHAFPDLFFWLDEEGTILDYKAGNVADLYPAGESLTGRKIQDVPDPEIRAKFKNAISEVQKTQALVSLEYSLRTQQGELFYEARILPLRAKKMLAIIRNITSRRRAEEALRQTEENLLQSQKMDALGRLAGGVAHDFNNLLTSILGFSQLALDMIPAENLARLDIQEVISNGERAAKLTRQLLTFARKEIVNVRPLDLNEVVVRMDQLLRRTLGEDIEMVTLLGEKLGSIEADAGSLEQVILNLAVNARDAMPMGGKLTIETARVEVDEALCARQPGLIPGSYVVLTVSDSGCGMSQEVKEHAFEPFYTSKGVGAGVGLGLSTVFGVVEQCGGSIDLESEVGVGTTFRIYIPRLEVSADQQSSDQEGKLLPRGDETILVVEDEDTVRRLAVRILKSLGYNTLTACNGGEALDLCGKLRSPIDLVMTDVVMPHMGGYAFVDALRRTRNNFKVLFVTGFTQHVLPDVNRTPSDIQMILKPYTRETLAYKVREVIDSN